jgi:hypothetical protein
MYDIGGTPGPRPFHQLISSPPAKATGVGLARAYDTALCCKHRFIRATGYELLHADLAVSQMIS